MFTEEKKSEVHNLLEQSLNVVQKLKIRNHKCEDERNLDRTEVASWFRKNEAKLKHLLNKEE